MQTLMLWYLSPRNTSNDSAQSLVLLSLASGLIISFHSAWRRCRADQWKQPSKVLSSDLRPDPLNIDALIPLAKGDILLCTSGVFNVQSKMAIRPLMQNSQPGPVTSSAPLRSPGPHSTLTSELQAAELEGDQAVADLDDVHQGVEVVGGQDEAVPRAVVPPAAQQEVPAQRVLQRARQVLVEDGVQVVVVRAYETPRDRGGERR